jgi:hypothetical protein
MADPNRATVEVGDASETDVVSRGVGPVSRPLPRQQRRHETRRVDAGSLDPREDEHTREGKVLGRYVLAKVRTFWRERVRSCLREKNPKVLAEQQGE